MEIAEEKEALFHALERVIADEDIWRDTRLGQRMVVVVADEEGETKYGVNPKSVRDRYNAWAERQYKENHTVAKKFGYRTEKLDRKIFTPDLVWGAAIFSGTDTRKKKLFWKNLLATGLFHRNRIFDAGSRSEDDADPRRLMRSATYVYELVAERQRDMVKMSLALEECALTPESCDGTTTGQAGTGLRLSPSEIQRVQAGLGGLNIPSGELEKLVKTGFVEGYTRVGDGSTRKRDGRLRSGWREAVMLTEEQMDGYARIVKTLAGIMLRYGTQNACGDARADLARLVLLLRNVVDEAHVSSESFRELLAGHEDMDRSCKEAEDWLTSMERGSTQVRIADTLHLPEVVPVSENGLLGIDLHRLREDLAKSDVEPVMKLILQFTRKSRCLYNFGPGMMLVDEKALDPDEADPSQYCNTDGKGKEKRWAVRLSTRFGGRYVFVPVEFLP